MNPNEQEYVEDSGAEYLDAEYGDILHDDYSEESSP